MGRLAQCHLWSSCWSSALCCKQIGCLRACWQGLQLQNMQIRLQVSFECCEACLPAFIKLSKLPHSPLSSIAATRGRFHRHLICEHTNFERHPILRSLCMQELQRRARLHLLLASKPEIKEAILVVHEHGHGLIRAGESDHR